MTILYSEPILTGTWWGIIIYIVMFLCIIALGIMSTTIEKLMVKFTAQSIIALFIALILCFAIGTFLSVTGVTKTHSDKLRYEVVLDQDYPLQDIYDKYNIIEHRGELWVLEDK